MCCGAGRHMCEVVAEWRATVVRQVRVSAWQRARSVSAFTRQLVSATCCTIPLRSCFSSLVPCELTLLWATMSYHMQ